MCVFKNLQGIFIGTHTQKCHSAYAPCVSKPHSLLGPSRNSSPAIVTSKPYLPDKLPKVATLPIATIKSLKLVLCRDSGVAMACIP